MGTLKNHAKEFAAQIWMKHIAAKGEFKKLKEETALVIPNEIPLDICKTLIEKIDLIVSQKNHPRTWRDPLNSDTRILGFEQDIGELIKYFDIENKINAIEEYTGRKTKSHFLMANRVIPKEGNLGSGGGMHRDSPFSNQVKCIWYLSEVTSETGPFQYIPGTHFNLIKNKSKYPLGETRFKETQDSPIEVTATAGSLLICDTKCIHGGKPIQSGARYAVTLYTLPKADGLANVFIKSGIDPATAKTKSNA